MWHCVCALVVNFMEKERKETEDENLNEVHRCWLAVWGQQVIMSSSQKWTCPSVSSHPPFHPTNICQHPPQQCSGVVFLFASLSPHRGKLQIFLHHLSAPSVTVWKRHLTLPSVPSWLTQKSRQVTKGARGFGCLDIFTRCEFNRYKREVLLVFFFFYWVIDHCVKHPGWCRDIKWKKNNNFDL